MANGYGNGSIVQLDKGKDGKKPKSKCRKWRLVVSLGIDPRGAGQLAGKGAGKDAEGGQKKQKRRYRQKAMNFQGTYTEAQAALRDFREKVMNGDIVTRTSWTFDEYAKHYVDTRVAAGEIQERTAATLRTTLRQLGHRVGGLKLQEITPEIVEQAYMDLRNGESISGRKLTGTTLFNINLSAYLMFVDAKKKGLIGENPLDKVPMPRKDTKEKRALPAAAYHNLVTSLDPAHYLQCAVLLCAALGLRRSESVGLSWGDIDFDERTVNVHASCDEHGDLKDPKTEAGFRILPMPDQMAESLMKRKAAQVEQYHKYVPELLVEVKPRDGELPAGAVEFEGKCYDMTPDAPVIANEHGVRTQPHALSVWWPRHRGDYGLDGWSLHELRHSFLSLAAARGVHPSIMQQLAGHKSAATTMDIYTHVNMAGKRAAMDAMQAAFM